jgi:arylsulfatase
LRQWKYKLQTTLQDETAYGKYDAPETKNPPALYDLSRDVGEQKNVAADHPDVVERMKKLADQAREEMGDRRTGTAGKNTRPIGKSDEVRVMSFNVRVADRRRR